MSMDFQVRGEKNELSIYFTANLDNSPISNSSGWLEAEETNPAGGAQAAVDCVILTFSNPQATPATDGAQMSTDFNNLNKNTFALYDNDQNGRIDRSDWQKTNLGNEAFNIISQGKEEITRADWNAYIDQLEVAQLNIQRDPRTWSQFEFFASDFNRDGKVSRTEWNMAGGQTEQFDNISQDGKFLTIERWNQFMNSLDGGNT